MIDDKLMRDEEERTAQYEGIKRSVKNEVGGEIANDAVVSAPGQAEQVESVASNIRQSAVSEVEQSHNEVVRGRAAARISQVIDYIFFLIYGLLTIRLLLELFGARQSAGFVQMIRSVTDPIYSPFRGIVSSPSTEGFTLALPIVIAIIVYIMLHLAINGLLRMIAHRKVEI